ncbi:MAG: copper resistance protein B [Maricaulis sp.]|nr:copper resistance protein B [Maricaulis sp.]
MRTLFAGVCLVLIANGAVPAQERPEDYYDAERMQASRDALREATSGGIHSMWMFDRLEHQSGGADDVLLWDFQGWVGGDENKFWLKSEGEYSFDHGAMEEAEIQALYSRPISPNFDLQFGVRHDVEPGPSQNYLVAGIQGLAPYWFEVDAAAFLSEDGDFSIGLEAEYELLLTQRWIIQPRAELDFAAGEVASMGRGSGLVSSEIGIRLRYEFTRGFAPYIGFEHRALHGDTADIAQIAGGETSNTIFAAGLRLWF